MLSMKSRERFSPCPTTPNCVSTEANPGSFHFIEPLSFSRPPDEAKRILLKEVIRRPRVRLIEDDQTYLRFEFRSLIFRFVDDVEFRIDAESKTVRFRSASRIGHGDLGANRSRMESIRSALMGKL